MIGGGGEKKTLRLVAQYADATNVFGGPEMIARKYAILREHCEGRLNLAGRVVGRAWALVNGLGLTPSWGVAPETTGHRTGRATSSRCSASARPGSATSGPPVDAPSYGTADDARFASSRYRRTSAPR
jgi:hypothetical protein